MLTPVNGEEIIGRSCSSRVHLRPLSAVSPSLASEANAEQDWHGVRIQMS
jgi:hypothetical protein